MTAQPLQIVFLGDSESGDFRPIVEGVHERRPSADIRSAADIAGLQELLDGDRWFPDLVVVLQAWPDQFAESQVHALMVRCALARIACCYGPWCDSDGRTRSIWPPAVRVPLAAASSRLARELALLEDGESARGLPLTASGAEVFEFDSVECAAAPHRKRSVAVMSADRAWKEMIEAAVRAIELPLHAPQSGVPPEAVIFDVDPWDSERSVSLCAIRAADPGARILAAVGFPRSDLAIAVRDCGADDVWFKLAPLCELVDAVA